MSAALIRHLWRTQSGAIVNGSYLDCHARGLHSLMLIDKPGAVVRMFVATPDHELHRNFSLGHGSLSIAFHNHDAELTLHVVRGQIINVTLDQVSAGAAHPLRQFRYSSQIRDGRGGFTATGIVIGAATEPRWLTPGETVFMRSEELHTVAIPKGTGAAWFVYEGAKNPAFSAIAYSNDDLTTFDPGQFYRRPTWSEVRDLLGLAIGGAL